MGFLELLTIIFVLLKAFGVIAWSWWLVFLPLIIAVGIYAIVTAIYIIGWIRMKREIDKAFDDDFFK